MKVVYKSKNRKDWVRIIDSDYFSYRFTYEFTVEDIILHLCKGALFLSEKDYQKWLVDQL
jgi:hypothetical protein